MRIELQSKAGNLCEPVQKGEIRCPLMIRPTSEDVVTDNLFETLSILQPRWWMPDMLGKAIGPSVSRRQWFRDFRIELWQKQNPFPASWLPWREGLTEVDAVISWENPATTIYVEMKYGSPISRSTTHHNPDDDYPGDQLIRNLRLGLWNCGWYRRDELFKREQRRFYLWLVTPAERHPLMDQYQNNDELREILPMNQRLYEFPAEPLIGQLSYTDFATVLNQNIDCFSRPERTAIESLSAYLDYKTNTLHKHNRLKHSSRQLELLDNTCLEPSEAPTG